MTTEPYREDLAWIHDAGFGRYAEVLGYAFDARNGAVARAALFAEVFGALAPGGLFLFDAPGPDRAPAERSRTFFEAGLRSCGFEVERLDAYAETALPPGLHGFRAAKPGGYTARRQAPLERRPA